MVDWVSVSVGVEGRPPLCRRVCRVGTVTELFSLSSRVKICVRFSTAVFTIVCRPFVVAVVNVVVVVVVVVARGVVIDVILLSLLRCCLSVCPSAGQHDGNTTKSIKV